jgi:hypothetical protein
MVNALLIPLLRNSPVHLVDVWDPGNVLRLMKEHGLGMGGGATYFLTSLLDHPAHSHHMGQSAPCFHRRAHRALLRRGHALQS